VREGEGGGEEGRWDGRGSNRNPAHIPSLVFAAAVSLCFAGSHFGEASIEQPPEKAARWEFRSWFRQGEGSP
jgi:hypothetical protein